MAQTFDIPIDVPWTLVAASPDMMDTTFADFGFPTPWRSSLAMYAYEPSAKDVPPQLCNQKVTYLKVTCSITGFQPTAQEVLELRALTQDQKQGIDVAVVLPNVPADVVEELGAPYYACYGVLLSIAVFPSTTTVPVEPPQPQDASFLDFGDSTLPDPFTDPLGLSFSLASGKPLITRAEVPPKNQSALVVGNDTLHIDMPSCTNVVLKLLLRNEFARGTVTAYKESTTVFQGQLPKPAPRVQEYKLDTPSPVTRVVIAVTAEECGITEILFDGGERAVTIGDYPHIVDFEPKTRDLYQSATDQGEILTASTSGISTGKSLSNTSSSEMGLGLTYNAGATAGPLSVGEGGSLTGKWGNTATDASTTQIDQSRERRETQGTTTNITQQYNILTGYHAGTNRAAFLMLPRPHTLQATDYRTFVRGLRMIEGVQEFFLVVSRPAAVPGICIETSLETGHFPETVELLPPPPPIAKTFKRYIRGCRARGADITHGWETFTSTQDFMLPDGWIIDTTRDDGGISWGIQPVSDPRYGPGSGEYKQADSTKSAQITTVSDSAFRATVQINGSGLPDAHDAICDFVFTIRALQYPKTADTERVVISPFLVTMRDLCACISSCPKNDCIVIGPTTQVPYSESLGITEGCGNAASAGPKPAPKVSGNPRQPPTAPSQHPTNSRSSIVYEANVTLPHSLVHPTQLNKSRTPAARELMHQIHHHLLTSWRLPQRRPHGMVGFLDSDYVSQKLAQHLPEPVLSRPLAEVKALPRDMVDALGAQTTVGDVLKLELHRLSTRAKVSLNEAVRFRRRLLGIVDGDAETTET